MMKIVRSQNGPREAEDLVDSTLGRRGKTIYSGLCQRCGLIFFKFSLGAFCSNKCANFKTGDNGSGYLRITVEGKRMYAHRVVVGSPIGMSVHHKN